METKVKKSQVGNHVTRIYEINEEKQLFLKYIHSKKLNSNLERAKLLNLIKDAQLQVLLKTVNIDSMRQVFFVN